MTRGEISRFKAESELREDASCSMSKANFSIPALPASCRRTSRYAIGGSTSRRRGFTLVEVLATLMLMTIALPVILQTISLATSAASLSKRRVEASLLCQSKMDELVATGQWQNGQLSGDFQPDWPDYTWTAQVEDFDGVSQELDVSINWLGRGNIQDSLTISTLIYPNNPITMANGAGGASGTSTSVNGGLP